MSKNAFLPVWAFMVAFLSLAGPYAGPCSAEETAGGEALLYIRAEWTFDGLSDEAKRDIRIVCRGDRIEAIGPDLPVPKGARIVEAPGMCVMPGLIDAHVRLLDGFEITPVFLFPGFGVTTVCDFENSVMRAEGLWDTIAQGLVLGPNMVYGGESLAGLSASTPLQMAVESAEDVEKSIKHLIDHGAGFVAFSSLLGKQAAILAAKAASDSGLVVATDFLENRNIDAFDALEMRAHRIDRMGGIPQALRADPENRPPAEQSALFGWLDLDEDRTTRLILAMKEGGVYLVPTLAAFEAMSRYKEDLLSADRMHPVIPRGTSEYWQQTMNDFDGLPWWAAACRLHFEYSKRFIGRAARAGIPIVAGSATPTPGVCPGLGLHRELELLVEAGLSPAQALKAATSTAAECLGRATDLGALEPGKRADLVIIKGNPLKEIGSTRNIHKVILGGKVVKREEIPGLK